MHTILLRPIPRFKMGLPDAYSLLAFLVKKNLLKMNGNRMDWEGKSLYPKEVASRLREDPNGYEKLCALLPKRGPELEETTD